MIAPVVPYAWRVAAQLTTLAGAPLPDHVIELLRHGRVANTLVDDVEYRPEHSTSEVIANLFSWPSVVRIEKRHLETQVA